MKEMNKQEKFDLGILIGHIVNVLFVLVVSLGLFDGVEFVSMLLLLSLTLVMLILMGLKWYNIKTVKEGKEVFEYIPFMSIAALEIIYGIKITCQLISEAVWMSFTCLFAFLLVCGMGACLYKEKCTDDKKKLICYALVYASLILYVLVCMVLLMDWWYF